MASNCRRIAMRGLCAERASRRHAERGRQRLFGQVATRCGCRCGDSGNRLDLHHHELLDNITFGLTLPFSAALAMFQEEVSSD